MKKQFFSFAMMLAMAAMAMAQTAMPTTLKVGSLSVPGFTVSIEKSPSLVQDAVNAYFKEAKLNTKKQGGYVASLAQVVPQVSASTVNLYTRITPQGKGKNKTAQLDVCAIDTNNVAAQAAILPGVQAFTTYLAQYVVKYEAAQNMKQEEANLKKANKELSSANKAVASLEKDIDKNTKKIEDNRKEIEKLQSKIKDLQKDNQSLQSEIDRYNDKLRDARNTASEKEGAVRGVENEVERYRQLSQ